MSRLLVTAQAGLAGSAENMVDVMAAALYLGFGLYCLAVWLRLRQGKPLGNGRRILMPGGFRERKCRHPEAYKGYMRPRVLALGMGLVLFGAAFLADHYTGSGSTAFKIDPYILDVTTGVLIIFAVAMDMIKTRRKA